MTRLCFLALFALAPSGCIVDPSRPEAWPPRGAERTQSDGPNGAPAGPSAFDPVSMRIHPLTHAEASGKGSEGCTLLLHIELRDRYGDAVKGVGALRAELSRGADVAAGDGPAAAWEVADLSNPDRGSARFDPSTRTYRLPLLAPTWLLSIPKDARPRGGKPRVRVTFVPSGASSPLADEMVLE